MVRNKLKLKKNKIITSKGRSKGTFKLSKKVIPLAQISKSGTLALNLHFLQKRQALGASINVKTVYFFYENGFNPSGDL